jgi:hypothetical protein
MTKNVNLVSKKKNLVPGRHYLLLKEESGDNFKVGKAKLFLQHDNEESFECHSNTFSTHLYAHIVVCEIFNYSKIVFPELDVEGFVENGITCWPLNKMVLLGEIQQTRDLPLIPSQRSVATSSSSDEESNATDESNKFFSIFSVVSSEYFVPTLLSNFMICTLTFSFSSSSCVFFIQGFVFV